MRPCMELQEVDPWKGFLTFISGEHVTKGSLENEKLPLL